MFAEGKYAQTKFNKNKKLDLFLIHFPHKGTQTHTKLSYDTRVEEGSFTCVYLMHRVSSYMKKGIGFVKR